MNVAKTTVGVGVKVLESSEKLLKKQAQNIERQFLGHKDSSPNTTPKAIRDSINSNVPPEDTKAECICMYKKDLGKLIVTEKFLKFRSLHYDELLPFEKISSVRKKGQQKVVLKLKDDSNCSFGPFDDIRRGLIYDIIKVNLDNNMNKQNEVQGRGININALPGLNDPIIKDLFGAPIPDLVAGTFKDPVDDQVCIDEAFDIPLKNLFALVFSDSATFLQDLQTKQGDTGLQFTKWGYNEQLGCFSRQFDFLKKSKLATATVHQTQLCRLKTPNELLFETSNKMEGVPFSDAFTVDTKWRVIQEGDKSRIKVWVRVDFKKSVSLLKGKIESGSVNATQDYFKEYAQFLRRTLSSGGDDAGPIEELPIRNSSSSGGWWSTVMYAAIVLIVLLLFYYICTYVYLYFFPGEVEVNKPDVNETIEAIRQQLEAMSVRSDIKFSEGTNADGVVVSLVELEQSLKEQMLVTSKLLTDISNYLNQLNGLENAEN